VLLRFHTGAGVPHFIVSDRKTDYLLPPSLDNGLSQNHLACFVVEVIDPLDLSKRTRQYAGPGSKARPPAALLAILVYGYATVVFSSRKRERATYDSAAFRYLAAGSHPDHDSLATFRRRFLDELSGLSLQILEMAREMKRLKLGNVCLDGAKIGWRRWRQPRRRRPSEPGARDSGPINLTEEESRLMPVAGGGFEPAYNAQAGTNNATMRVVAIGLAQASAG